MGAAQGGAVERGQGQAQADGSSLSGGQQQCLRIARGIAIKPEVILLDEPCSALDPISTAKIEELITELKTDYTVVIVKYNMQQAARCSDYTYMYLTWWSSARNRCSSSPRAKRPRITSPAASVESEEEQNMLDKHLSTQFDTELSSNLQPR